jgi:hypothetical protein
LKIPAQTTNKSRLLVTHTKKLTTIYHVTNIAALLYSMAALINASSIYIVTNTFWCVSSMNKSISSEWRKLELTFPLQLGLNQRQKVRNLVEESSVLSIMRAAHPCPADHESCTRFYVDYFGKIWTFCPRYSTLCAVIEQRSNCE